MSKIAIITDTHFGARNDSVPMMNNMQLFYERVFFPTLDTHKVTTVLHGGDYVDRRKYINYVTAQFIEHAYRAPLRQRNVVEIVLLGNHDIYYKDTSIVNAAEEMWDHDDMIVVKHPMEHTIEGVQMLLLPWINAGNELASLRLIQESTCPLVLGHLELAGFDMFRGITNHDGLSPKLFDRFDLVMSGHYHHPSTKGPVKYLGAPYPMTWGDYNDPRGFHLFDTHTKALTFVPNPYSLFVRCVYDDTQSEDVSLAPVQHAYVYKDAYVKVVVKAKTNVTLYEQFIESLHDAGAQEVIVVDDIVVDDKTEAIEANDLDTLTLIDDYVNDLSINCDKARLQTYLRETYKKALEVTHSTRLS